MKSPKEEMNLYVKITKTIAVKAKQWDTIEDLKMKLCHQECIPVEVQELFFAGTNLRNNQRLLDYNISENSTIHLIHGESLQCSLTISIPCQDTCICLEVPKSYTIQRLKAVIQDQEGICPFDYELYSSTRLLQNTSTVASLDLDSESTLQMIYNPKDSGTIHVQSPSGDVEVEVRWMHTVLDVKKIIEGRIKIPSQCMELFAGEMEEAMEDDRTLAYYEIIDGDELRAEVSDVFQVKIRFNSGMMKVVDVTPSFTVLNLKQACSSDFPGIPAHDLRALYYGLFLQDNTTLLSCGIHEESIIDMLWCVRGR